MKLGCALSTPSWIQLPGRFLLGGESSIITLSLEGKLDCFFLSEFPVCSALINSLRPPSDGFSFLSHVLVTLKFKHLAVANMRFSVIALALGLVSLTSAKRSPQHVGKKLPEIKRNFSPRAPPRAVSQPEKRHEPSFLTDATKSEFAHGI